MRLRPESKDAWPDCWGGVALSWMATGDDDGSALGDGIRAGATWIECLGDLARYRIAIRDEHRSPA
jgi:hypothetical protein